MILFTTWVLVIIGVGIWTRAEQGSSWAEFGAAMIFVCAILGFGLLGGIVSVDTTIFNTTNDIYWLQDSTAVIVSYSEDKKMVEHISDQKVLDCVENDSVNVVYKTNRNSYGGKLDGRFIITIYSDSTKFIIRRTGNGL